ncbi:MAG: NAD(P)-binding domain-containing protein [Actinomycetota bacterium]|nr:NAD(P)-binding domain-containing protein [Actinomycetota bacterium]
MAIEAIVPAQDSAVEDTSESPPADAVASRKIEDLRLGIVGAGKLGTTIARATIAAGYDVAMSGSGPADDIALTVDVLARGARAVTTDEAVRHADIIALAVPTHRFRDLPPAGYSSTR